MTCGQAFTRKDLPVQRRHRHGHAWRDDVQQQALADESPAEHDRGKGIAPPECQAGLAVNETKRARLVDEAFRGASESQLSLLLVDNAAELVVVRGQVAGPGGVKRVA